MHSDPQMSFHAIAPPFRFSHGGKIHRSCTGSVYLLRSKRQDEDADRVKELPILILLASSHAEFTPSSKELKPTHSITFTVTQ